MTRAGSEAQHQEALFAWAQTMRRQYPELDLLYHVPNGGKRDYSTGKAMKREGVKAGIPDITLPVGRGGYYGLYVELKVGKTDQPPNKKEWLEKLSKQGYCTAVCYGWQEAAKQIEDYLLNRIQREDEGAADSRPICLQDIHQGPLDLRIILTPEMVRDYEECQAAAKIAGGDGKNCKTCSLDRYIPKNWCVLNAEEGCGDCLLGLPGAEKKIQEAKAAWGWK